MPHEKKGVEFDKLLKNLSVKRAYEANVAALLKEQGNFSCHQNNRINNIPSLVFYSKNCSRQYRD
jgi:hypothetical protein